MSTGGWGGSDAAVTLEQFQADVADGQISYYVGGGQGGGPGGNADSTSSQIAAWVAANYTGDDGGRPDGLRPAGLRVLRRDARPAAGVTRARSEVGETSPGHGSRPAVQCLAGRDAAAAAPRSGPGTTHRRRRPCPG